MAADLPETLNFKADIGQSIGERLRSAAARRQLFKIIQIFQFTQDESRHRCTDTECRDADAHQHHHGISGRKAMIDVGDYAQLDDMRQGERESKAEGSPHRRETCDLQQGRGGDHR